MRKLFYWLIGIAASPFILFLLLTLLLYCPPIQRWAVGIATQYASESTGKEISIGDVRLRFPLDLQLDNVSVIQRNDTLPQRRDTLLTAERAICNVQLRPLFDKQVNIDILQLDGVKLNTVNYISDCRIKGSVGRFLMHSHGIDLLRDTLLIDKASLDNANLDICLSDTAKEDTTSTPSPWKIRVQDLAVTKTHVMVHLPGDTLNIASDITKLTARNGFFDLQEKSYEIAAADLNDSRVCYDNRYEPKIKGLDYNHLDISKLNIGVDSFYFKSPDIRLKLRACNMQEKSGLALSNLTGEVSIDSTSVNVSRLALATPSSHIDGDVHMDFNTFAANRPGQMSADINASIGRDDVMLLAGNSIPKDIFHRWPAAPATISGRVSGNMRQCTLDGVRLDIPTLASGTISGTVRNLDNTNAMTADVQMDIAASGNNGHVKGTAHYAAQGMAYDANLDVQHLNINHFMPGYGLGAFTGHVKVKGQGTDIMSPRTKLTAEARIDRFSYGKYNFNGSKASVNMSNGVAHADITTTTGIMDGHVTLDALVNKRVIRATVGADVRNIDLYALRLVKAPLSVGVCGHIDIDTDMKDNFMIVGGLSDIRIQDSTAVFHPNDINMDIMTRRDTTHAVVDCGDFHLNADAHGGYKTLMALGNRLSKEVTRQINERVIDESLIRKNYPEARIFLETGDENPVARFAKSVGYSFSHALIDVTSSPVGGLNGTIEVDTLVSNGIQLDDIRLALSSDSSTTNYDLKIANGADNPQYTFTANAKGGLRPNGTNLEVSIDDKDGKRGIEVGLEAEMTDEGIRINIDNDKQILGYRKFSVNNDNYILLQKDMHVLADVRLVDEKGTGLQIYTDDEDATSLQDVTFSIHRLDIANILTVLPYMPKVSGILDGDFHVIVNEESTTISADIDTQNLVYEDCLMGNISTELTYMPKGDGSHYIDGILMKDDEEIAMIEGTYYFGNNDRIDATLELERMPMDIINGFIPDQLIGFKGIGIGKLKVEGYVSQPVVNGSFDLSQASIISVPYGVELRLDDAPVEIRNSLVLFNNFQFYASNDKPINLNGSFDFSNTSHMTTDLRLRGENVQIIDAKENRRSEAYGKAFVNIYGRITGEVSHLSMRMKLDVLPATNLYYILRDSPITTDNRLKELVTFTDLSVEQEPQRILPTPDGIDITMNITINEGSHVTCWLNSNHTNYLDLIGSGDLTFKYAQSKMSMNGRYTMSQGEMKYSLPVIPLKTFQISTDSYIEFTGDVMNPTLNITATERNRAAVTIDGENSAPVDFVCGVVLSKTLNDMGLQFIISAPDDNEVNEQLNMMSIEDRGKLAVTMLTTGMYLSDTNTSHITMNSALSSFLQQEINNIAGAALKTIDLQLGLENSALPDGTMSTDYSFKFAKRFWNNRVSVSIGGHISTGQQAAGKTNSVFDNIEFQYRLSDTSNQYVGLFYKHDVYDYLEGYLDQYGATYTWKRKLQNFKEIFPWVKPEPLLRLQSPTPSSLSAQQNALHDGSIQPTDSIHAIGAAESHNANSTDSLSVNQNK